MLRIFVRYNSRHGNCRILNSTDQVYQDCTQNSGHCPYSMFYFHRMCLEKRVKIFMSMTNKFSQILRAVRQRLTLHSVYLPLQGVSQVSPQNPSLHPSLQCPEKRSHFLFLQSWGHERLQSSPWKPEMHSLQPRTGSQSWQFLQVKLQFLP